MKRLAALGVGSAVILGLGVMGAAPAFADNGPHVSSSTDMTVDRCAGCHRAHTAQDAYLLKSPETQLCQTCHDGTTANTDVVDGTWTGTGGGALRAGGFTNAKIDGASGVKGTSIGVLASATSITSSHTVGQEGVAWGGGAAGTDGTAIELECASCHDPHGNGNFRILRPVPSDAAGLNAPAPVGITSITPAGYWINSEGRTRYYYDVVTSADHKFKASDTISFYDTNSAYDAVTTSGMIGVGVSLWTGDPAQPNFHKPATLDARHFTFYSGTKLTATASQGRAGWALSNGIAEVIVGTGTNGTPSGSVRFYTWNLHGLYNGQSVTTSGTTGYNVTKATIANVDMLSFTVVNGGTSNWAGNGQIVGIPDVVNPAFKIYTTANYWMPDDHNYTGVDKTATVLSSTATAAGNGPTAFISNISAWCAQCHTRLYAGNGAWEVKRDGTMGTTADTKFTVMHRSQSGKEGSPNCVTCHVAHGTSAAITAGGESDKVGNEFATTNVAGVTDTHTTAGDSFLLRVNNRGTCNMCHGL